MKEIYEEKIFTTALALALSAGICGSVSAAETAMEMKLRVNDNVIKVNDMEKTIDAVPVIVNGRTLVVRAVVEELGGKADWDAETKTAMYWTNFCITAILRNLKTRMAVYTRYIFMTVEYQ